MKKYDVIVIGSGGGAKIISPAARLGLKVAAIEREALGGTCLNRGCIPSKMLIHPADVACEITEAKKFDIHVDENFSVNFAKLIERISNTVDSDSKSIKLGYDKNPNIDFYHTTAKFLSNKVVKVDNREITADLIFLAVGTRPHIPEIEGLKGTPFMTSTEALRNTKLPKKLIIIGGGYIATELGHAYGSLGCDVTFLVRSKLLRHEDSQTADEFYRVFSKRHTVHLGAISTKVKYDGNLFTVTYKDMAGDAMELTADALLVATGIIPNTDTLMLSSTDVQVNERGFIVIDNRLETAVKGIYALGDCTGRYFYRHSVNFEGEYLFRTLFVDKTIEPIKYPPIPHAIFTYPQVAGVGLTEDEAKETGIDYIVGLNDYKDSAMGMALLSDSGFVKLLFERTTKKLIGAHIVGDEASDMIHIPVAFMNMNATLDDLLRMVYIHPALPEIVRNAARKAKAALESP